MNQTPYMMDQAVSTPVVINRTLRNTYVLLAMSLAVSALAAVWAMKINMQPMGPLLFLAGAIGGQFLIAALRNSAWGILAVFAWTAFMGATLGPIINAYLMLYSNGAQLVALAMGGTAAVFFGMSGYALVTKRNLSFLGGMLFAGMIVAFVAAIANIWLQMTGLSLAISAMSILVFSGFILYETQQIVRGGTDNYILATVSLYASIWSIFVHLLNLLGFVSGED